MRLRRVLVNLNGNGCSCRFEGLIEGIFRCFSRKPEGALRGLNGVRVHLEMKIPEQTSG